MHMADAMLSPAVGGIMLAATVAFEAYSLKKLNNSDPFENKKIPIMGISGAFVFAAQMINFTIPATGSSGHLGGGLLLAALLGPNAGFIVLSVVLAIQALFFADGGLLAFGANAFNMGFFACFLAYPLIMRPMLLKSRSKKTIFAASLIAASVSLLLGAFSVVIQTTASGITELPFLVFTSLMLPIHLAIGIVEGIVTALVLSFVNSAEPDLLDIHIKPVNSKKTLAILGVSALICGICLCWFASSNPDGLEWSILKITGDTELSSNHAVHASLQQIQEATSTLPDYSLKNAPESDAMNKAGNSISGIVGSLLVLIIAVVLGFIASFIKSIRKRKV